MQLQRMRPAWKNCRVSYVTTLDGYKQQVISDAKTRGWDEPGFFVVTDANRWQKFRLLKQVLEILFLILRLRPDVVISTGAAPGFFAIKLGKLLGAKTIWIDSIANAEELSLSGQKVRSSADLWITQWEHLASSDEDKNEKPRFFGSVI